MVNRGKIAELYHPDWIARPSGLVLADSIPFAEGFAEHAADLRDDHIQKTFKVDVCRKVAGETVDDRFAGLVHFEATLK